MLPCCSMPQPLAEMDLVDTPEYDYNYGVDVDIISALTSGDGVYQTPTSNVGSVAASDGPISSTGASANDNSNASNPLKAKTTRPARRPASSLTPSQLARKRAHDREAQRTARQRTKDHIDGLEKKLEELTGYARDAQELERARQRNNELEEELARLRTNIASSSGPPVHPDTWVQTNPQIVSQDPWGQSDSGDEALYLMQPEEMEYKPLRTTSINTLPQYNSHLIPFNNNRMAATQTSPLLPYVSTAIFNQPATYWELPVKFLPPNNPVDSLLISIINAQRQAVADGHQLAQSRQRTPNLYSFLFPNSNAPNDVVSNSVIKILRNTAMQRLPEKVASFYMIYKALQWQIRPTQDTYEGMPGWFSPRPSQLVCPHPSWVSQIKFPKLRDKVISNQSLYATELFLAMYTSSLYINWPYGDAEIFKFENGRVGVTDLFEDHILKMENWSLTEPFTLTYPELEPYCRFTNLTAEDKPGYMRMDSGYNDVCSPDDLLY